MVQEHLSIINVPINNNKTQLIIIQSATNINNNKKYHTKNKSKNKNQKDMANTGIINDTNYELQGIIIEKKDWIKLLGMKVDNQLDFNEQIKHCK